MTKQFFSCDWGSSSFRLRMVDSASGSALATSTSDEGILSLNTAFLQKGGTADNRFGFFSNMLEEHIKVLQKNTGADDSHAPIVISGMASSNIGMIELPYALLPFATDGHDLLVKHIAAGKESAHPMLIISGARTDEDIMRGEETQLVGCAGNEAEAQLFIFPGTHSKHISTANRQAKTMTTFMTGEFFRLLSTHSMLAGSVTENTETGKDEHANAFAEGLAKARTSNMLHAVFTTRTRQLLKGFSKTAGFHYLSGLLLGAELASIHTDLPVTVTGEKALTATYCRALEILHPSAKVNSVDAATATLRGQHILYRRFFE